MFLSGGDFGTGAGWRVKAADAGCRGADSLGQRSLGHQLSVNRPGVISLHKGSDPGRMSWGGDGANHPLNLPGLYQRSHINSPVGAAVFVGDSGEIPGALPVQGGDEVLGRANPAKIGEHYCGPVGNIGHRSIETFVDFVLHRRLSSSAASRSLSNKIVQTSNSRLNASSEIAMTVVTDAVSQIALMEKARGAVRAPTAHFTGPGQRQNRNVTGV